MVRVINKMVDEEQKEAPIHGDILEAILSHVPLIDLVPASHVSKSWSRAVSSSLRHFNSLKPWLIVHTQTARSPYVTTTRGYDPRSRVWVEIQQPPIKYVAALRSSDSNLAYMLSPSKLSFSFDPLHLTWHHADAPLVWRTDPIVALVGNLVVVAGGTCDFEDDPLAVEIYDAETGAWDTCESMPATLKDSAASTWLSIANNDRRIFVSERHSGVTYTFTPATKTWCGPYDIRPDPSIFYSVVAFSDNRLILIGLIGDAENVKSMKLWEVNTETLATCDEIGEAPIGYIEKLKSKKFQTSAVSVCFAGKLLYVYNPSDVEEVLMCEFINGGCRWRSVVAGGRSSAGRVVLSCSEVGLVDVCEATRLENVRFEVKEL